MEIEGLRGQYAYATRQSWVVTLYLLFGNHCVIGGNYSTVLANGCVKYFFPNAFQIF